MMPGTHADDIREAYEAGHRRGQMVGDREAMLRIAKRLATMALANANAGLIDAARALLDEAALLERELQPREREEPSETG